MRKIELSIPSPCHQSWQGMSDTEKGRYCQSCKKEVIDFSRMSNTQLVAYFNSIGNEKVCGRFYRDQLNTVLQEQVIRKPWYVHLLKILFPAFLFSQKMAAQSSKEKPGTILAPYDKFSVDTVPAAISNTIKGKIVDQNGEPIAGVAVMVKGKNYGVAADASGRFSLRLHNDDLVKPTIQFSAVGFEAQERIINVSDTPEQYVLMPALVLGDIGYIVVTKHSRKKKRMSSDKPKKEMVHTISTAKADSVKSENPQAMSFKLFPNPVKAGTSINLVCGKLHPDYYRISLFNSSAQEVMSKKAWIDGEEQIINLSIPSVSPGNYLLTITREGEQHTEKLIIEN